MKTEKKNKTKVFEKVVSNQFIEGFESWSGDAVCIVSSICIRGCGGGGAARAEALPLLCIFFFFFWNGGYIELFF